MNNTQRMQERLLTGEVLTKKELAARLRIGIRTVERWQGRDYLPFIKVHKLVMFYWPDVVEGLRRNFGVGNAPTNGE